MELDATLALLRRELTRAQDALAGSTAALTLSQQALASCLEKRQAVEKALDEARLEVAHSKTAVATSQVAMSTSSAQLVVAQEGVTNRNEFLAMVAHDLRSPLTAIKLSADVLLKLVTALEGGRSARKLVERIQSSAGLMNHFIEDLLDVTHAESGRLQCKIGPFDAGLLLEESHDILLALADEKGLKLVNDAKLEPGTGVLCDRPRFLQLLTNLVGNAIKFTDRGGTITIGAEVRGNEIIFSVADTGVGIEAHDLPHVFDHYWKGKGITQEGFGLGLTIVRNLVEAQGGTVSVTSVPAQGSTFAFTLPRSVEAPAATQSR